jgi:hypothetical protein
MHAIDAFKHPRKAPLVANGQEPSCVLNIWSSQVHLAKPYHHRFAKTSTLHQHMYSHQYEDAHQQDHQQLHIQVYELCHCFSKLMKNQAY